MVILLVVYAAVLLLSAVSLLHFYRAFGGRWGSEAVGDFTYMGLFKRVKGTLFAVNDTRLYIPLCLFLAVAFGLVFLEG